MMTINVYDVSKYFCICALSRCYEVASLESFPQCVSACWELLCSEAFFLLLSNFTGLRLHYLSPSDEDEEEEKDQEDEEEGEATGSSGDTPSANKNNKGVLLVCVCTLPKKSFRTPTHSRFF